MNWQPNGGKNSRWNIRVPEAPFKRPEGYFAGKLIEDAGLRGYQEGGAQVSEKHCGFVINRDHATASDIAGLCGTVQKRVYEQFGGETGDGSKDAGLLRY